MSLHQHIAVIPATPAHWRYILDAFQRHLAHHCEGEHTEAQTYRHRDRLAALMRGGLARVVVMVPNGHAEVLGWAAALGDVLVFAYVRELLRCQGLGAHMVASLTESVPVRLAYWTPSAREIRAHGFPIVFDRDAYDDIARIGRARPRTINERTIACEHG